MRRLNNLFDGVLRLCAFVGAALIGLMAMLISANVIMRNLGLPLLYGLLDAVQYALLVATFLGAPWALWKNAHVTVDLVTAALPRAPARLLARLVAGIGLAVSAVFLFYAVQAAGISAARGSMIRTAFVIPEWWVLAVAPVGFALICIEFLRQMLSPPEAGRTATGL